MRTLSILMVVCFLAAGFFDVFVFVAFVFVVFFFGIRLPPLELLLNNDQYDPTNTCGHAAKHGDSGCLKECCAPIINLSICSCRTCNI